jgi:signal transduction histidine kinase
LIARVRTITRLNRYHTLTQQREELRAMTERLVVAQEEERQRISRELHDDLGQSLTTQMISLRNLQDDLTIPAETLFERLQSLHDQTYEIFVKIRRLAQDLRPPVLDALGLKVSMQTYCTEFTRRTHLPVTVDVDDTVAQLPDLYKITLYRLLQEALNNIIKHSKASHAWVELSIEEHAITLTIQDNGQGFEQQDIKSRGMGLSSMNERVTLAGGTLKITSTPGRGTILSAQFPWPASQTITEQ